VSHGCDFWAASSLPSFDACLAEGRFKCLCGHCGKVSEVVAFQTTIPEIRGSSRIGAAREQKAKALPVRAACQAGTQACAASKGRNSHRPTLFLCGLARAHLDLALLGRVDGLG
jgi:hypothetical protein